MSKDEFGGVALEDEFGGVAVDEQPSKPTADTLFNAAQQFGGRLRTEGVNLGTIKEGIGLAGRALSSPPAATMTQLVAPETGAAYEKLVQKPIAPVEWWYKNVSLHPLYVAGANYLASKGGVVGGAGKTAAGAIEGLDEVTDFFRSPQGIALSIGGGLPAAAQKAVSAGFALQMASQLPDEWKELVDAVKSKDTERISKAVTKGTSTLLFTGLAGAHAVTPTGGAPRGPTQEQLLAESAKRKALAGTFPARVLSPAAAGANELQMFGPPEGAEAPSGMVTGELPPKFSQVVGRQPVEFLEPRLEGEPATPAEALSPEWQREFDIRQRSKAVFRAQPKGLSEQIASGAIETPVKAALEEPEQPQPISPAVPGPPESRTTGEPSIQPTKPDATAGGAIKPDAQRIYRREYSGLIDAQKRLEEAQKYEPETADAIKSERDDAIQRLGEFDKLFKQDATIKFEDSPEVATAKALRDNPSSGYDAAVMEAQRRRRQDIEDRISDGDQPIPDSAKKEFPDLFKQPAAAAAQPETPNDTQARQNVPSREPQGQEPRDVSKQVSGGETPTTSGVVQAPQEPVAPPAAAKGKEPWEMTAAEFEADSVGAGPNNPIVSAAVMGQSGKVYRGGIHAQAYEAAKKALDEPKSGWDAEIDVGYVTRSGKFIPSTIAERAHSKLTGESIGKEGVTFKKSRDYNPDHLRAIRQAFREGKPVPPEVLADYPELKPPAAATAEKGKTVEQMRADTFVDEMFAAPLWTEKYKGMTAAIRDLRERAKDNPAAGIPLPAYKRLTKAEKQDLLAHGFTFTVDRMGKPLLSISKEAQADVLRRQVMEKAEQRKAQQPIPPAATEMREGPGEGKRRKTLKELRDQNNLGGEAGFINLSPVVDAYERLRDSISIAMNQGKVKDAMSWMKDRANNMAAKYANEVGSGVNNLLLRATKGTILPSQRERLQQIFKPWKDPNELYKSALTVGVESFADAPATAPAEVGKTGVDRLRLQRTRLEAYSPPDSTMAKWKDKALASIDYAIANWGRLEPVVRRYMRETGVQAGFENLSGVDTLTRNGYVMHETDLAGSSPFDFLNPRGGGEGAIWRKNRIYPTYVDKIIGNSKPVSMDAIALLKARINSGQRKINNAAWTETLKNTVDPTSGKPVLAPALDETRADGTHYKVPVDDDYKLAHMGYETYSIHKGYSSAFESLTNPSWFSKSLAGETLMKAAGTTKHVVLAFDTFHLGRLALWSSIIQGKPVGYKKGLVLLRYSMPEIQEMARRGEIPREYLANIAENKRQIDLATKTGFNVARIQDALWQDWTQKIPGTGAFQKWLFGEFQQGAMMQSWLVEFARQRKQKPTMPESQLARKVSKELNTRFGNLQSQGIFKSKTAQDLARLFFLAPQWNEGLIRSEIGAVTGAGKTAYDLATKQKLAVSALTRSAGILFLAQFAANQLINYVTRGKPTWQNEEDGLDAKASAYIPDMVGEGPGLFLSPMALPAETAHLLYKLHERTGDWDKAIDQYARSRLGTVTRPIATRLFHQDNFGKQIKDAELWREVAKSAAPVPISGGAVYQAGKQLVTGEKAEQFPGQFQKQALSSVGIKTEGAPTALQRIGKLAREYNKAQGKTTPEFDTPYANLDRLLRVGNTSDASKELKDLLKKKTPEDIVKRYEKVENMGFTHGSREDEAEFFDSLTKPQQQAYLNATMERAKLADKFFAFWAKQQLD